MANPVVHFEIIGKNRELLESFYENVFSWRYRPVSDHYSMILPGEGISGGIGSMPNSPCNVTFYVSVEDIEATLKIAESKGGHRAFGPDVVPGGPTVAGLVDPEGHLIGIMQQPAR